MLLLRTRSQELVYVVIPKSDQFETAEGCKMFWSDEFCAADVVVRSFLMSPERLLNEWVWFQAIYTRLMNSFPRFSHGNKLHMTGHRSKDKQKTWCPKKLLRCTISYVYLLSPTTKGRQFRSIGSIQDRVCLLT